MSDWALQAGEMDEFCETTMNKERKRFWKLMETMEKEFSEIQEKVKPMGDSIDLLEVFCRPLRDARLCLPR